MVLNRKPKKRPLSILCDLEPPISQRGILFSKLYIFIPHQQFLPSSLNFEKKNPSKRTRRKNNRISLRSWNLSPRIGITRRDCPLTKRHRHLKTSSIFQGRRFPLETLCSARADTGVHGGPRVPFCRRRVNKCENKRLTRQRLTRTIRSPRQHESFSPFQPS